MKIQVGPKAVAIIVLTALVLVTIEACPVHATAPTEVDLEYNLDTQALWVNVTHEVPNPQNHYVELIEVFKNGLFQLNRTYPEQPYFYGLNDTFTIAASGGDNLTVTATCSRGDSLSNWIIVSESTTTTGTTSTTSTSTAATTTTTTTTGTQTSTQMEPLNPSVFLIGGMIVVAVFVIVFVLYQSGHAEKLRPLADRIKSGLSRGMTKFRMFLGNIRGHLSSRS